MDPKRPSPPLPAGIRVTVMYAISRGQPFMGIESSELARVLNIDEDDYIKMSDWSSVNDAYFYSARHERFSYDIAVADAAAMNVPRIVFYRIPKDGYKTKTAALLPSHDELELPPPPPVKPSVEPKTKVKKTRKKSSIK
jgi:hypothetical protein